MTLNAALPSATSFDASCHVSDWASEFVYDRRSLNRLSAVVTLALDQSPPFFQRDDQPLGPSVAIITVSNRCFCVQSCPRASGITPAFFASLSAAMNASQVFGTLLMPAFFRPLGLYQRMFARWMFTGTEYRWPLYVICLISCEGMILLKPYFL